MSKPSIPTDEEYNNLLNAYTALATSLFNDASPKVRLLLHGLTKNQLYEIGLAGIFIPDKCVPCPDGSCVPKEFPCHPFAPGKILHPFPPFPPHPRPPIPRPRTRKAASNKK